MLVRHSQRGSKKKGGIVGKMEAGPSEQRQPAEEGR